MRKSCFQYGLAACEVHHHNHVTSVLGRACAGCGFGCVGLFRFLGEQITANYVVRANLFHCSIYLGALPVRGNRGSLTGSGDLQLYIIKANCDSPFVARRRADFRSVGFAAALAKV